MNRSYRGDPICQQLLTRFQHGAEIVSPMRVRYREGTNVIKAQKILLSHSYQYNTFATLERNIRGHPHGSLFGYNVYQRS